jgi:outer membrane protein OmpA-like peptidoglycan-associated protein
MKHFASIILALALALPTHAQVGFRWCLYGFNHSDSYEPIEAQLEELAEFIKSYPDDLFEISGHLDERANDKYSIKFDKERADYIRGLLIDKYGIPSSMLISVGKNANEPYIRGAKTEAEHELNRRVEIRIIMKE